MSDIQESPPHPQRDAYAHSLIESLSDLVDTLNEAKADGLTFNFQIVDKGDKFALVSLVATGPVALRRSRP